MDPGTLLFAEVIALVGIAAFLTSALIMNRPVFALPGGEETPLVVPPVSVPLLCPDWSCGADVTLGLKRDRRQARIGVLDCDLLLLDEGCDGHCVTPLIVT